MIVGIIVGIVAVAVIVGFVFVNQPSFGRAPQGERLERIKKCDENFFHETHLLSAGGSTAF